MQKKEPKQYYRINLKLPIECKAYLQEMVWRTSYEEHRDMSITGYITQLVFADMEKNQNVRQTH